MRLVKVQGLYVGDYDLKGKKIDNLVLVNSVEKAMNFEMYEDDLLSLAFQLDGEIVHGEKKFVVEKTENIKKFLEKDKYVECQQSESCWCELCC